MSCDALLAVFSPACIKQCAKHRHTKLAYILGAWRRRAIAATLFRKYYVRGDLPISVDHTGHRNAVRWKIRPAELDFHVYLPIFFDGLREVSLLFSLCARSSGAATLHKTCTNETTWPLVCPRAPFLQLEKRYVSTCKHDLSAGLVGQTAQANQGRKWFTFSHLYSKFLWVLTTFPLIKWICFVPFR